MMGGVGFPGKEVRKMAGISGLNTNYFFGTSASGISTLFGSLGSPSGVSAMSSVISDYNTIKTGTYGKLLKAYYGQQDEEAKDRLSKLTSKKDTAKTELQETYSTIKSKADKLASSAQKLAATGSESMFEKKLLKHEDGTTTEGYDVDSIYSAVSDFAKHYTDMLDASVNSSNQSIANGARSLTSTTQVMSSSLQKIGIDTTVNGKLSVDEEAFKKADMAQVKRLFNGANSYGANVAQTASRIEGTTSNKLSSLSAMSYGKNARYSTSDVSSLFNSYF